MKSSMTDDKNKFLLSGEVFVMKDLKALLFTPNEPAGAELDCELIMD